MKNSIIPNINLSKDEEMVLSTVHYIKDWVIPFYHVRLNDWEQKKNALKKIWEQCAKPNMIGEGYEQISDFENNNNYHVLIENVLYQDMIDGVRSLGFNGRPRIANAWYQIYNNSHHHPPHNHGLGALSTVVFVDYSPENHFPTTFIAPFTSLKDGNVMEYIPADVDEGSMIIFPSGLMHYAPTNQSDNSRMIMAANIRIGD